MSDCLFATFAAQFSKLTSQFGTNIINLIILSVHSILLSILMLCLFFYTDAQVGFGCRHKNKKRLR